MPATDAFSQAQAGMMCDEAAPVCDRLHHREGPGRLCLRDQFGLPETELARRGLKLLRVRRAPDARARLLFPQNSAASRRSVCNRRQAELKYSAARLVCLCP